MDKSDVIVRVAVPVPLSRCFDYIVAKKDIATIRYDDLAGIRVEVPFGRSRQVGVILQRLEESPVQPDKLKFVTRVLDSKPALPADVMRLVTWASRYYHCPIGEAVATALPAALRKNGVPRRHSGRLSPSSWRLTDEGRALEPGCLRNAPLQQKVLDTLRTGDSANRQQLSSLGSSWRACLARLCQLGWVEPCDAADRERHTVCGQIHSPEAPALNAAQQTALDRLLQSGDGFAAYLLEGVTGSGKTELYLRHSAALLAARRQVLVIVPEIGLTPQLVARFRARFGDGVVALHSGLSDGERLRNWRLAASGEAPVVVGTRSSVFVPFQSLGVIIVDEEHDGSLKQHDGFRYHARDLALVRARDENIPVVLGSATPSLETLHNALAGKYRHLKLKKRAGLARAPQIRLLDVRRTAMNEGLSGELLDQMKSHLEHGNQVMLFLNRRGYAPVMLCESCDATVDCLRCDAHMTVHAASRRLRCHHCGAERPVPEVCTACGSRALAMAGQGTERVEYALQATFPRRTIVRIDRDTTRRKGALHTQLEMARSGAANILIGTQMLAKGHHFPGVTLVAILDVDRGFYGVDFRSAEQMAQIIVQVAGRAGREEKAGEVTIQTRHPDNPLFQTLIHRGYAEFASTLLDERRLLGLPPCKSLALIRAEAAGEKTPREFLQSLKTLIHEWGHKQVEVLGPASAPIERVAGRYRAQLLLTSSSRSALHRLLGALRVALEENRESRKVRWSLDVDPVDLM